MQVTYCDKCKKKIKKDNECSVRIYGNKEIFGDCVIVAHLCEKCAVGFGKIWKKFMSKK